MDMRLPLELLDSPRKPQAATIAEKGAAAKEVARTLAEGLQMAKIWLLRSLSAAGAVSAKIEMTSKNRLAAEIDVRVVQACDDRGALIELDGPTVMYDFWADCSHTTRPSLVVQVLHGTLREAMISFAMHALAQNCEEWTEHDSSSVTFAFDLIRYTIEIEWTVGMDWRPIYITA